MAHSQMPLEGTHREVGVVGERAHPLVGVAGPPREAVVQRVLRVTAALSGACAAAAAEARPWGFARSAADRPDCKQRVQRRQTARDDVGWCWRRLPFWDHEERSINVATSSSSHRMPKRACWPRPTCWRRAASHDPAPERRGRVVIGAQHRVARGIVKAVAAAAHVAARDRADVEVRDEGQDVGLRRGGRT
jgi:hypothetical protein